MIEEELAAGTTRAVLRHDRQPGPACGSTSALDSREGSRSYLDAFAIRVCSENPPLIFIGQGGPLAHHHFVGFVGYPSTILVTAWGPSPGRSGRRIPSRGILLSWATNHRNFRVSRWRSSRPRWSSRGRSRVSSALEAGNEVQRLPIEARDDRERGRTQLHTAPCNRVEHGLLVGRRTTDYTQDLACGRLLIERFREIPIAQLQLVEQPHVLDRNDGLIGEGL